MLAQAHLPLGRVDSAVTYLERHTALSGMLGAHNLVLNEISFSLGHFRLGKLYTQLEQYDRAKEHFLTFLQTFTQPDAEYVWMREEAQQALEDWHGGGRGPGLKPGLGRGTCP